MPYIHIQREDSRTETFSLLKDETTLGRNENNDIVLSDSRTSRHHAKITKKKKGYYIIDLGSFNGVKLNGKFVQNSRLKDNDEIFIGLSKLIFSSNEKLVSAETEGLELTSKGSFEDWQQQTMESSPEELDMTCQSLLITPKPGAPFTKQASPIPAKKDDPDGDPLDTLLSLERMNKVLFVLYEISRQLNSIHDFNDLLKKIMDLIFMVIDADYGFVVLTGEKEELIPVVVKSKKEDDKNKGKHKASRSIISKVIRDKVALLTSNAMQDSRLSATESLIKKQIRSAMCVPLWEKDKIIGAIQLDSTRLDNQFSKDDLELLKTIGCQMAMIIGQANLNKQIREEEQMRDRLERFHSPQVIEMILKGDQETKDNLMEPKDLTATILFTDIVEFTSLSEKMPPREINMILNQHFSRMTDIIFEYDGTLDKYLGDGLMAVFGAPMEKKDDAERAIKAALKMREELDLARDKAEHELPFNVRIGINTGRVVAGNIGSPKRMDYTVLGDPVNIANRLETIAEPNQILIGPETYKRVKKMFKINKVGPRMLKGKSKEITVYEVLGDL